MASRHGQDVDAWVEKVPFSLGNYHDRGGLVGAEYFYFLGDVAGIGPAHAWRAHNYERFGRKINVFFVFDDVEGYRLVAQLRKLYPYLRSRNMVRPAADNGPRTTRRRGNRRHPGNFWPLRKHLFHEGWQFAQGGEDLSCSFGSCDASRIRQPKGEKVAGSNLGIERLGRGHAHLDVTAVGGVQHPVRLLYEVAVAPIDYRHHVGPPTAHQVDGAVRVRRGTRLADRYHQRRRHVVR